MKRKPHDQILGHDPWDVEWSINADDVHNPEDHFADVIIRYMNEGDLLPLAAAIRDAGKYQDGALHPYVLEHLITMIHEGRLIAKPAKRGRRSQPSKLPRDYMAYQLYERGNTTFAEVADRLHMTEASVRKAVTHWRKHEK
jgi:hypothetical protein